MATNRAVRVGQGLWTAVALLSLACSTKSLGGGSAGVGGVGGGGAGGVGGGLFGGGGGDIAVDGGGFVGAGGDFTSGFGGSVGVDGGFGGGGGDAGGFGFGVGGNGGNGGIAGTPLVLPSCVSDLLSACPLVAPCVQSVSDAGLGSELCFAAGVDGGTGDAGGVRATVTPLPTSGFDCTTAWVVTVTKADGSPCYSFEDHEPTEQDCTTHTWTWKDASGQLVATGSDGFKYSPSRSKQITCAVGGATTTCMQVSQGGQVSSCCGVGLAGSAACPDGVNPLACTAGACP